MDFKSAGKSWFRYPLHIHISSLFIIIVMLVCGVQLWLTYSSLNKVLVDANDHLFDRISGEARANLLHHYSPAFSTVTAFSKGQLSRFSTHDERLGYVPEISYLLSASPSIFSYTLTLPNGDHFSVYRVFDRKIQKGFEVSPEAHFVVFSYYADQQQLHRYEYDEEHELVNFTSQDGYQTDLREREWFGIANSDSVSMSAPYYFQKLGKIGVTVSRRSESGAVVAADITLDQISQVLAETISRKSSFRVLYDESGRLYAYSNPKQVIIQEGALDSATILIEDIDNPVVHEAVLLFGNTVDTVHEFYVDGEKWIGKVTKSVNNSGHDLYLMMVVKSTELLDKSQVIAKRSILTSLIVLLIALPFVYIAAQRVSAPIRRATLRAQKIESFDFSRKTPQKSHIKEIHDLSQALFGMQQTLSRFLLLTNAIARQDELKPLLDLVANGALDATSAKRALLYLSDDDNVLIPHSVVSKTDDKFDLSELSPLDAKNRDVAYLFESLNGTRPKALAVEYQDIKHAIPQIGTHDVFLFLPLLDRGGQVLGGFGLIIESEQLDTLSTTRLPFIESLSEYASVAIESQQILANQKALLNSFIEVMAGAIDTKSPYTGNHCQRVPVLTEMLTKAAEQSETEPFKGFKLSSEEWQELQLAAWLHDCGKVTTPEHVVDKAVKLETIYNRIHEIRTRFEVLKRDAHILILQQALGEPLSFELQQQLDAKWQRIDDDFAFIAATNVGGEFMTDDAVTRLHSIAQRQWTKTIDEGQGLSWEERRRYEQAETKPGESESVLADQPYHAIPWAVETEPSTRFTLKKPMYQNNLGELYNLSIRKGTLNDEERYVINNHIVETIKMLESLPFPKGMRNVPAIAGGHHEKVDGTGYPMGLKADEMPLTARVMALADVFEALTSADRPYKEPKTLSESIKIMSFMVKDQHLDAELFKLFLTSGVYQTFAMKFLNPEQIDEVDIEQYLS
ncbi:HD domain-containing phosphohydrolase [Vibrio mediterranei]|uniref:HAMP domain-containing protein n=1 Tax=Vibrio mediterranei TaxID=689 RepID=A0A3G4VFP0_9VIBR|nr:HD domain-containing phosphohydrolase [Vibrio mediterranei]AYV23574.1 HAMP domain-containing protein [Vibrio mediterranei]